MIWLYVVVGILLFAALCIILFWLLVVIRTPRYSLPEISKASVVEAGENHYVLGNNWLRQNKWGVWEMYVEGEALERGIAIGKLAKDQISQQERFFFSRIREIIPSIRYLSILRLFIAWFNRNIEKYISEEHRKEIFGISLYAPKKFEFIAKNYQRYLNYHAAHDIGHVLEDARLISGCTSFAAWGGRTEDGKLIVGRNFDFYMGSDFNKNKLVTFVNPKEGLKFVSIAWAGLVGAVSGMNEKGITVTINAAKSKIPWSAKTPTTILVREILQYASNLDEAYKIAESKRLFVSEILLVSSASENKAALFEVSPYKIARLDASGEQVSCSNHYQSEAYANDPMNITNIENSDSVYRLQRMNQLLARAEFISLEKSAEILRNWRGVDHVNIGMGNQKTINQFQGHHSVIFKPCELKMWVSTSPYNMGEYICYDFNSFINKKEQEETGEIVLQNLNIKEDDFIYSYEFQTFMQYRENMSSLDYEREKSNRFLGIDKLFEISNSNPFFYIPYLEIGRLCHRYEDYRLASSYYNRALSCEIPTKPEREFILKQKKECDRLLYRQPVALNFRPGDLSNRGIRPNEHMFFKHKCCVIIPTYNNQSTLSKLIWDVMEYTHDIIVVNDGSTDNTGLLLSTIPQVHLLHYEQNQGKGFALRKGFLYALKLGFDYAITIDSDGQHFPENLHDFLRKLDEVPGSLIVGARNMQQEGVPMKSSFGNKFSNFWFKAETGIKLPDTQSGYRLYPIRKLNSIKFFTRKFEFEIEVMVRAAWKGINVTSVPVKVKYTEDRVSHFRPARDFFRIGLLNTVLFTLAILFVKPFKFIQDIRRNSPREFFQKYIVNSDEPIWKIATAIGFGVLMGIVPIWGWQLAAAITLAHFLKLNKVIVAVAAQISIPPMIPVILYLSYICGGLIIKQGEQAQYHLMDFEFAYTNFLQYVVGSFIFAPVAATVMWIVSYFSLVAFRKKRGQNNSIIDSK